MAGDVIDLRKQRRVSLVLRQPVHQHHAALPVIFQARLLRGQVVEC
jgi:hypothetical protein